MEISLVRGVSFTKNTGKKLQNLPASLPRWSDLYILLEEDGDSEVWRTQKAIVASGWPFLALWCERDRNVYRKPEGGFSFPGNTSSAATAESAAAGAVSAAIWSHPT